MVTLNNSLVQTGILVSWRTVWLSWKSGTELNDADMVTLNNSLVQVGILVSW